MTGGVYLLNTQNKFSIDYIVEIPDSSVVDICVLDDNNFACACDDGKIIVIDRRLR